MHFEGQQASPGSAGFNIIRASNDGVHQHLAHSGFVMEAVASGLLGNAAWVLAAVTVRRLRRPQHFNRYIAMGIATRSVQERFGRQIAGLPDYEHALPDGGWQFCYHRSGEQYEASVDSVGKVSVRRTFGDHGTH